MKEATTAQDRQRRLNTRRADFLNAIILVTIQQHNEFEMQIKVEKEAKKHFKRNTNKIFY